MVHASVSMALIVMNFIGAGVQETFQKMLSLAVVLQLIPFLYMFSALLKLGIPTIRWERLLQQANLDLCGAKRTGHNYSRYRTGVFSGAADYFLVVVRNLDVRRHVVLHWIGGLFLFHLWTQQGNGCSQVEYSNFRQIKRLLVEVPMAGGVKADVRSLSDVCKRAMGRQPVKKTFPVYDPAAEEVIAAGARRRPARCRSGGCRCRAAFESGPWGTTTAQERGRVLFRLAEKIRQNLSPLAEIESRNSGKPIVEAEYDITDVATCFEYYGGLATKIVGYVNPVPDNAMSLTLKEPIGVAGQIIPWNYPLLMAAWKLAPALAAAALAF